MVEFKLIKIILRLLFFFVLITGAGYADPSDGEIDSVEDLKILEPGHWYTVKGSAITSTNWSDSYPCNSPWHDSIEGVVAYSGAAVSQQDHALYVHGGGHGGTSFNGILGFDLDTLNWKCVEEPSPQGVQDEWEGGKAAPPGTRLVVNLSGTLFEFMVTSVYSTKYYAVTGSVEPNWSIASDPGKIIVEDNNKATWTNLGIIGWQAGHNYTFGERIIADSGKSEDSLSLWGDYKTNYDFYKYASNSGFSASSKPDWSQCDDYGETCVDGGGVWINQGMIYYENNYADQENGNYPWDDRPGSTHTYWHVVFSEKDNALVNPVSYTWEPSNTGFISNNPWIYYVDTDNWVEKVIDSDINQLGAINLSSATIDQNRNKVWFYRKEGASGPRLWELDLSAGIWTARDDGKTAFAGNGTVLVVNPDTDQLFLLGTYNGTDSYSKYSLDPNNFDSNGYAKQDYYYLEGGTGAPPTGDWDFIGSIDYQAHFPVYDTTQDIIVDYAAFSDSSDDIRSSIYILIPSKNHWVKIPAAPTNKVIPIKAVSRHYGRFNYIEYYNCFVFVDQISSDVYIYKLSGDIKDTSAPVITSFDIPDIGNSRTIPIEKFTVSDEHQWTVKYAISESEIPPLINSSQWINSLPSSYSTNSVDGEVKLFAYAMDMFGNISSGYSDTIILNNIDVDPPVVNTFSTNNVATSLKIEISNFTANDNIGVEKYLITENGVQPSLYDPGWVSKAPRSWMLSGGGNITLYAWTMDANGNISSPATQQISVELSDHIDGALQVGPYRQYKTLEAALKAANQIRSIGQRIEIDAGSQYAENTSSSGLPMVSVDDLTITGVSGGLGLLAHIYSDTGDVYYNGMISTHWAANTVTGLTLKYLELSGSDQPAVKYTNDDGNGRLLIEHCLIYDNEDGVLVGEAENTDVIIRYSEFFNNGDGSGQYHNIYIGNVRNFTMEYCYSHDSHGGQLVKTRANKNIIQYNRITDEGVVHNSNYPIDIPSGGESYVIGNLIQKAADATVDTFINYGREAKIRVYYTEATNIPSQNTYYDIYRAGFATGEQFYAQYSYGGYLYSWGGERNTEAGAPDVRPGDMLKWNNGNDFFIAGENTGWDWNGVNYDRQLYVIGNTIVNEYTSNAYFIRAHIDSDKIVAKNNLIIDRGGYLNWDASSGGQSLTEKEIIFRFSNVFVNSDPGLNNLDNFDYSLKESALSLINQGDNWGVSDSGKTLTPYHAYLHPLSYSDRVDKDQPDVGAYEYGLSGGLFRPSRVENLIIKDIRINNP